MLKHAWETLDARWDVRGRWSYHVPILAYHRVGPSKDDHVPTVSAEGFARHLACLAARRYRVMSLEEIATWLEQGAPCPSRSVAITFDDGYEETSAVAWPMLRRYGMPAAVFVTPTEVGREGFCSWEQVRRMAEDGMTIGNHTMHHSYVPLVPADRLAEELMESKRMIEAQIQRSVEFLSFPVGGFTLAAQQILREAGYRAAFTTNRGRRFLPVDRYALRRIKMTERDAHPLFFRIKISGHYDLFRRLKAPA